ncbi:MAG TPA: amidohydrolase [Thermoanaerobaculia bacterium]|jgi:amidohydrolase|nr:amidohydrolase [Thermoanaerobaculia bacterium]
MTLLETLLSEFPPAEYEQLVATRRDLHRHPELAFEERRTAGVVAGRLRELGLSPREGLGRTGVVADAGAGGSRLMLRADMDALPLVEANAEPYASQEPGRMHACGHDGHVAMGLAVARRFASRAPGAPLRFLFQPAEEGQGGAQACADDGVLEGVGSAFGLHLWSPKPVGWIGVNRGALMAAVDSFEIEVEGRGGHGAAPHETSDPIVAAARIVEALQSVVSREISPLDSAVVTIGSIHGGTAFNIIPGSVRLTGTARSFTEATGKALPEKIRRIVAGTAAACGVAATVRYDRVNSATVNDAAMAELVTETASRLLGDENVETDTRTLGGEDMSVFLNRVPGCFFFVGCAREGPLRPHHSPRYDMDERALAVGTAVMEAVLREAARRLGVSRAPL